MNFREFVSKKNKKAFRGPRRFTAIKTTENLPHEPGSLTAGMNKGRADTNNARAQETPSTGEVVGKDTGSGDSLVRQPGNRVVRVQATGATVGNTVNVSREDAVKSIRKRGAVTNSSIVRSTGWEPVSGKPSASRTSTTFSAEVENLNLIGDPCTPPDVKIELVKAALDIGVSVNASGQVTGFTSDARTGLPLNNQNSRDTYELLDELYEQEKRQGKQSQSLPQVISLDSLGGSSTAGVGSTPNTATLWSCRNGNCVQDPNGFFATKAECESLCGEITYNCVDGECVEVRGPTGQFRDLAQCLAAPCNTRWACVNGTPVPQENGPFASKSDAISGGCYWGYSCVGGECQPVIGGNFRSLQCCQENCIDLSGTGFILVPTYCPDNLTITQNGTVIYQSQVAPSSDRDSWLDWVPFDIGAPFTVTYQRLVQGGPGTNYNYPTRFIIPRVERGWSWGMSGQMEVNEDFFADFTVGEFRISKIHSNPFPARTPSGWINEFYAANSTLRMQSFMSAIVAFSRLQGAAADNSPDNINNVIFSDGRPQESPYDSGASNQAFGSYRNDQRNDPFNESQVTFTGGAVTRTDDVPNLTTTWAFAPFTALTKDLQVLPFSPGIYDQITETDPVTGDTVLLPPNIGGLSAPGASDSKFSSAYLASAEFWGVDYQLFGIELPDLPEGSVQPPINSSFTYQYFPGTVPDVFEWERLGYSPGVTPTNKPTLGDAGSWYAMLATGEWSDNL